MIFFDPCIQPRLVWDKAIVETQYTIFVELQNLLLFETQHLLPWNVCILAKVCILNV